MYPTRVWYRVVFPDAVCAYRQPRRHGRHLLKKREDDEPNRHDKNNKVVQWKSLTKIRLMPYVISTIMSPLRSTCSHAADHRKARADTWPNHKLRQDHYTTLGLRTWVWYQPGEPGGLNMVPDREQHIHSIHHRLILAKRHPAGTNHQLSEPTVVVRYCTSQQKRCLLTEACIRGV